MRVQVYRNLHKPGVVYSVRDKATGRVVDHAEAVLLQRVKFVVREGGRQRVLREKRKNVHAFVEGERMPMPSRSLEALMARMEASSGRRFRRVRYNPYLFDSFVSARGEKPVAEAEWAIVSGDGLYAL